MKPRLVFWETTRLCNLECPHCRASAHSQASPLDLNTDEAKSFIGNIASFSKPILVFSGGEPLLREDIYELLQYASDEGLKTAVATNATLITEDVSMRLKKSGIRVVSVSIYGASAVSHDGFCGKKGAFSQILNGIENLKKANIPFQINTTITKKNLAELEAMGDFALKQGAVSYHVFFLVPTGRARYIEGDEISSQEYEQSLNNLYDLQINFPLQIKATCAPHYYRILQQRSMQNDPSPSPLPIGEPVRRSLGEGGRVRPAPYPSEASGMGARETKGCLAGQGVCFISHKGEVFGCGYLSIPAGDLKKEDFEEIWFESELFKVLRDTSRLEGKCAICEFRKICGGCRARAYQATGNYLAEEPNCVYK